MDGRPAVFRGGPGESAENELLKGLVLQNEKLNETLREENAELSDSRLSGIIQEKEVLIEALRNNISKLTENLSLKENQILDLTNQLDKFSQNLLVKDSRILDLKDQLDDLSKRVEDIENENDHKFKGYIDAVVSTPDGKVHIFDWKTCSWGWDSRRRSEKMTTYQLTLYKHFFAQKMEVDPKSIETHFALLKRTAKKNRVELFRVTSGPRKTENALKLLHKALYNIKNKRYIKNRLSCERCTFRHTKECP